MAIDWNESWVEVFGVFLIVVGLIIALFIRSSILSYTLVFLAGVLAGRGFYLRRLKEPILPFVLLIVGFLLGYVLGAFWINRILTIVFFVVGFELSYYLHMKKIITIFKNKNFIK